MKLGIYIQVPFCQTKCTYCNFHTGVASPAAYAPYASAVETEIRNWRDFFMRQKPRDDFVTARKLLMSMTFARRALLPPDNPSNGLLGGLNERLDAQPFFAPDNLTTGLLANTIYLGGGTPSLFDPADLARILDAVRSEFAEADATGSSSRARAASTR